ncbi:hypothetical protein [Novosphingobium sp.]|uniref:hypothetical protein n=1 Tax=Novosphingobium sp. TaxID=1874826 RepID=UPI0025E0B847|nr:hypothetical protein [Novosphingobium sp.]
MTGKFPLLLIAVCFAMPGAAVAKTKPLNASPQIFRALVDCKQLPDPTARLACYDKGVSALEQAALKHDVVIADREMIREARRAQFGYTMPSLRIFGGSDEDAVKELQTKVRSARDMGLAMVRFTTEEGSVWQQTESRTLAVDPKPGTEVVIKAHAFGRYTATFKGQVAINVQRVQ